MQIAYFPMSSTRRRKMPGQLRYVLAANVNDLLARTRLPITTAQKQIAALANVSLSTMQRICKGEAGTSLDKIEDLAEAFDVSVIDLLTPSDRSLRALGVHQDNNRKAS